MAGFKNIDSENEVTFDEQVAPPTPTVNKLEVYAVDDGGATKLAYLNSGGVQVILQEVAFCVLPTFSAGNSIGSLAQVVTPGSSYGILTSLLESGETQEGNQAIVYKDTSDVTQATILDEANNKFLFPSNLNTYGEAYVPYMIRATFTIDFPAVPNATTKYLIRLVRQVDDSIVAVTEFIQSDFPAETGVMVTSLLKTFVEGEADPFVVDGVYLDILNDVNSASNVTIQEVSVRIFRG